jgi:hypothetical protein
MGEKWTLREHPKSAAHDLGCVKTQKPENRREQFFFNRAILNALPNLYASECDFEECLFSRRRASPRFHTAKTHSGALPSSIGALQKVHLCWTFCLSIDCWWGRSTAGLSH